MKAVCWNGKKDIRVQTVPDPQILNPRGFKAMLETGERATTAGQPCGRY